MEIKKEKEIDSRIPLTKAMGVTKEMTPKQVSDKWIAWSAKYPEEKIMLSPAVIISLDTLATMITLYETLLTIIDTVQSSVIAAGKAYKVALAMLPGIGGVDAAKTAAEESLGMLKKTIAELVKKIHQLPQIMFEQLTNTKVNEKALL